MYTSSVSDECSNRYISLFQAQENTPLPGRIVVQLRRTTNQIVYSINHVAQFILSKCIGILSLGRYTLDDIKNYLFTERALKNLSNDDKDVVPIEENIVEDQANIDISGETIENERKRYGVKRQDSLESVSSSVYNNLKESQKGNNLYPSLLAFVKKKGECSSQARQRYSNIRDGAQSLSVIEE